jgi:hypothetical protein
LQRALIRKRTGGQEDKKIDYTFGAIAVSGLILWYITDNANIAITFSILAEMGAAAPTILKTFQFPETESRVAFGLTVFGFALGILSIQTWTYENYAFILYLFLVNALMFSFSLRKPSGNLVNI